MSENKIDARWSSQVAMLPYWTKVDALIGGTDAMRAAHDAFLPKFEAESAAAYKVRWSTAPYTDIFGDIITSLSSRPFSKPVDFIEGTASQDLIDMQDNVDGAGTTQSKFAASIFRRGITHAIEWVLVDAPKAMKAKTRPYWLNIPATKVIAVATDYVDGQEVFTHFRFFEEVTMVDGLAEKTVKQIRVFNRERLTDADGNTVGYAKPTFEVFKKIKDEWTSQENGELGIDEIPIVPFLTGERVGASWEVIPPMRACADLQIHHFRTDSGLEYKINMSCYVMIVGHGVTPETGADGKPKPFPVGPMRVAYTPMNAEGKYGKYELLEPSGESNTFVQSRLESIEAQLRELGNQPLTAGSNNITVIAAAFASKKANTAAQQWAINLQSTLENAWRLTSLWMGKPETPEIFVFTDFDVGTSVKEHLDALDKARKAGDISRATLVGEYKRRGVLGPSYDEEADAEEIINELPGGNEAAITDLPPDQN